MHLLIRFAALLATGTSAALLFLSKDACGQTDGGPPNNAAYWTVPAFADKLPQGPTKAKGIIFWSHGVSGQLPQYQYPTPPLMRQFANAGWDIIKINRNPIYENSWINAGLQHAADLSRRVDAARKEGYSSVVAAGQSYGGAISIEASARNAKIDAVLAFSPGHGSDARNFSVHRRFDMLTDMLIEAIARAQAAKLVVLVAENDDLHPFELRGPKIRAALTKKTAFVLFDESMPIKGHGAGQTNQFAAWYGVCLRRFVEAAAVTGETHCRAPEPTPQFLPITNYRPPNRAANNETTAAGMLSGTWVGAFPDTPTVRGQEVAIYFQTVAENEIKLLYMLGAGPENTLSMSNSLLTLQRDGTRFVTKPTKSKFALAVTPRNGAPPQLQIVGSSSGNLYTIDLHPASVSDHGIVSLSQ